MEETETLARTGGLQESATCITLRQCASNRLLLQRRFKEASTLHGLLVFKTRISASVPPIQARSILNPYK